MAVTATGARDGGLLMGLPEMPMQNLTVENVTISADGPMRIGNAHDLIWKNKIDVENYLKKYFTMPLPVYEGIILKTATNTEPLTLFFTHGHQGDKMSDNNAFSTWIVAHLWTPIQRYLQINVNTPSKDDYLRNKHNKLMYEWSSNRKNILLITGHTHHPVFASGKYSNHPSNKIESDAHDKLRPSYFNTGCCCFNDGDITGIEIEGGAIRLIKWHQDNTTSTRMILEEIKLVDLIKDLKAATEAGKTDSELVRAQDFQRKAQFYLDFVEAENSTGFHAPQEAARILGESVDFSRKGQIALRDGKGEGRAK